MLCFDDYDDTTIHPEDLNTWLMAGADYNVWKTPGLARDLQSLTTGNQIPSPVNGSAIQAHFFMQNTMMSAQTVASDGAVYIPFNEGKIGMIDVRDIVDVAVLDFPMMTWGYRTFAKMAFMAA